MLMLHELLSIIKPARAFKQQEERELSKVTNGSISIAGQVPGKPAVLWRKLHCARGINTLQYLPVRENL